MSKYLTGNQIDFNQWHDAAKIGENIPPEGKINKINNIPAPDCQRTMAYSSAVPHPSTPDFFCWLAGDYPDPQKQVLSLEEVKALGFFPPDPMFSTEI